MDKNEKRIVMVDPDLDPKIQKLVRKAVESGVVPKRSSDSNAMLMGGSFGVSVAILMQDVNAMGFYMVGGAAAATAFKHVLPHQIRQYRTNSAVRKAYTEGRWRRGGYPRWMEGEELVRRAAKATEYVLTSRVHIDDQLDSAHNNLVLPRQVWDLMGDLEELDQHIADEPLGKNAAVAAHHKIVEQIQVNCERRVQALETYALQVMDADKRYSELKAMEKLEAKSSGLLDLLARTSAVDASVAEISVLTGQAAALVESYQTALAAAREAGLVLTAG